MDYSTKISERMWNLPDKGELEAQREQSFIDDIIQKAHIEKELLQNLEGISTAFDGGAGSGRFSILLAKRGIHVTHFDISQPMIDKAKELAEKEGVLENITFVKGALEDLSDYADRSFDLVMSFDAPISYTDALGFSSGMAAISALMEIFHPGDHLIVDTDLYGGSIRLFNNISVKNGIEFTSVDCHKENAETFITDKTRAVFIETPTNPMMNVTDIEELAKVTKKHNILLIVDNTFLSPYFQNPLELGADIVVHSGTKFLGGHNDTIAGFLVTNDEAISEKLHFIIKTTGAGLAPFDSWLILRGIKTLAVRMERAQENTIKLAHWLKEQKLVKRVIYPGLPSHPGHEIMKKQSRGFGAMLTFEVESKETALTVLKNVKLISFAESLGGTETLITYPTTQTHADVPKDVQLKNGITDCILRMSVGIENIDDIIVDLSNAFAAVQ